MDALADSASKSVASVIHDSPGGDSLKGIADPVPEKAQSKVFDYQPSASPFDEKLQTMQEKAFSLQLTPRQSGEEPQSSTNTQQRLLMSVSQSEEH